MAGKQASPPPAAPWLRPAVWLSASTPALTLAAQAATGRLSAEPVADVMNRLGLVALVLLLASLACTPLRALTGFAPLAPIRRTLGLFAFWYAFFHVGTYVFVDQGAQPGVIVEDIVKRPFILFGFLAFLVLLALAVTSPLSMVKRLGAHRWKLLHRTAYLAGALAVVHFFMRVKKDVSEPVAYGSVLALLLLVRLVVLLQRRQAAARASTVPPPPLL